MKKLPLLLSAGVVFCLALTFCAKKSEEQVEEKKERVKLEESLFLSRIDSLRWLGYLRSSPEDTALAYLMLGALYLANNLPEQALNYLETASRYDPDRASIYLNIGDAYNRMGEYDKATEAFRRYVQRAPGSPLSREIFRIVEKYHSIESEAEIP